MKTIKIKKSQFLKIIKEAKGTTINQYDLAQTVKSDFRLDFKSSDNIKLTFHGSKIHNKGVILFFDIEGADSFQVPHNLMTNIIAKKEKGGDIFISLKNGLIKIYDWSF